MEIAVSQRLPSMSLPLGQAVLDRNGWGVAQLVRPVLNMLAPRKTEYCSRQLLQFVGGFVDP